MPVQFSAQFDRRVYFSEAVKKARNTSIGVLAALFVALVFQLATNGSTHSTVFPLSNTIWTMVIIVSGYWVYRAFYVIKMFGTSEVRMRASNQKITLIHTYFQQTDTTQIKLSDVVGFHVRPEIESGITFKPKKAGTNVPMQALNTSRNGSMDEYESLDGSSVGVDSDKSFKLVLFYLDKSLYCDRPIPGLPECTNILRRLTVPHTSKIVETLKELDVVQLNSSDINVDSLVTQGKAAGALPQAISERKKSFPVVVSYWICLIFALILVMQRPTDTEYERIHHDAVVVLYVMFLVATANLVLLSCVSLKPLVRVLTKYHPVFGYPVGRNTYEESMNVLKDRLTTVMSWATVCTLWNTAAPAVFFVFSLMFMAALERYLNATVSFLMGVIAMFYRFRTKRYLDSMHAYARSVSDPVSSGVSENTQSLLFSQSDMMVQDSDSYAEYMWSFDGIWDWQYIVVPPVVDQEAGEVTDARKSNNRPERDEMMSSSSSASSSSSSTSSTSTPVSASKPKSSGLEPMFSIEDDDEFDEFLIE